MHDLINRLIKKYGNEFSKIIFWKIPDEKIQKFIQGEIELEIVQIRFLINGQIFLYDGTIKLQDQDEIVLFLPLSGG